MLRATRTAALAALLAAAGGGCTFLGPPVPTDAPPPAECQRILDACEPVATEAGVSAADDCVRIARDETTTAEHCVEVQPQCAAACSPADAAP